jgi:hypothetical protein
VQPAPDGLSWVRLPDGEEGAEGQEGELTAAGAAGGSVAGTHTTATQLAAVSYGFVPADPPVRYVLTHGELEAGASGAAAPLLGVPGIEGSVGVVMLAESVPERVGPRVVEAATEVADALR